MTTVRKDSNESGTHPEVAASEQQVPARTARRPYQPPRLTALGDIRGLTLGGTRQVSDSATALRRQV